MNILGIIPARGGSKGVPKKNIRQLSGKPLVHYSIIRGLESELLTHLYLSTDSEEIIEKCKDFKKLKIHKRPAHMAQDTSPTSEAVLHLLNLAEKENQIIYDYILILQPTSPLRFKGEIDKAIKAVSLGDCNSLISVCSDEDMHPARMYHVDQSLLVPLDPELETKRRQELKPVYFRDGSYYIVKAEAFKATEIIMLKPSYAFERDSTYLVNIDSMRDLMIAEVMLKAYFED